MISGEAHLLYMFLCQWRDSQLFAKNPEHISVKTQEGSNGQASNVGGLLAACK